MGKAVKVRNETPEAWRIRAAAVHGDKCDFSISNFTGANNEVDFICPEHGVQTRKASVILGGGGCKKCSRVSLAKALRTPVEKVRADIEAAAPHLELPYLEVEYTGKHCKVTCVCKVHGETKMADVHQLISGKNLGCETCGREAVSKANGYTNEEFIRKCKEVYGDIFDYSRTEYTKIENPVIVTCHTHGHFSYQASYFLHRTPGCPDCREKLHGESWPERHIRYALAEAYPDTYRNGRMDDGKQIDIVIPSLKVGLEFNGSRWHNDERKADDYHFKKSFEATKSGMRLFHVFGHEHDSENISRYVRIVGVASNSHVIDYEPFVKVIGESEANAFHAEWSIATEFPPIDLHVGFYTPAGELVAVLSGNKYHNIIYQSATTNLLIPMRKGLELWKKRAVGTNPVTLIADIGNPNEWDWIDTQRRAFNQVKFLHMLPPRKTPLDKQFRPTRDKGNVRCSICDAGSSAYVML